MVMNKKGFLKILEAIIAIIIVLAFVIAIIPSRPKETAKFPPDLEQTTNSLLKEMQNNPIFRQCVLNGTVSYDFNNDGTNETLNSVDCVNGYITLLSEPVLAHPWNYSVRICKVNTNATALDCNYYPHVLGISLNDRDRTFVSNVLPKDKDIYTRTITLTVPDISGQDPSLVDLGNYSVLTVYAWLK